MLLIKSIQELLISTIAMNNLLSQSYDLGDCILPSLEDYTIAIIGLGYVGLPLALEFSRQKSADVSYQ